MKLSKKFILGSVLGALLLGGSSAFAWTAYNKNIPVRFAQIKLIVDGQVIKTKAEPFIYNGNVYAPVATVANALGIRQNWNNAVPGVHFDRTDSPKAIAYGMYITAFEDGRSRGGGGTSYQPMYNVVSLVTAWKEEFDKPMTFKTIGVRDYSTDKTYYFGEFFKDWDTLESASLIPGSGRPDITQGNNLTDGEFSLQEVVNGGTRVSKYMLKDGKISRMYSFKIDHEKGVIPKVFANGLWYTVQFHNGSELLGVQNYQENHGQWQVTSEVFK